MMRSLRSGSFRRTREGYMTVSLNKKNPHGSWRQGLGPMSPQGSWRVCLSSQWPKSCDSKNSLIRDKFPKFSGMSRNLNFPSLARAPRIWAEEFWFQPIPGVAPRIAPRMGFSHQLVRECNSESCSENTMKFSELL